MKVELIEFPNDKLTLLFSGGGTYMVYNTGTKQFVECNRWPASLSEAIYNARKQCSKGFYIKRGNLSFVGI